MAQLDLEKRQNSVSFRVRAAPRASREAVTGIHDGALKVSLFAPPVEGEANQALVALLARTLGVPRRAVTIVRGERSRTKTVLVEGLDVETVRSLLELAARPRT